MRYSLRQSPALKWTLNRREDLAGIKKEIEFPGESLRVPSPAFNGSMVDALPLAGVKVLEVSTLSNGAQNDSHPAFLIPARGTRSWTVRRQSVSSLNPSYSSGLI